MIKDTDELIFMRCEEGDRINIYLNGKIIEEGCWLPWEVVLNALGIKYKKVCLDKNPEDEKTTFPKEIPCPYQP